MSKFRITVDTGGTFTDVVYYDEGKREITIFKLPSTPHDPSEAIIKGVEALLEKGVAARDIEYFCHGTTVGTNALLEGKGGVYLENCEVAVPASKDNPMGGVHPHVRDEGLAERLWARSEELTGVRFRP